MFIQGIESYIAVITVLMVIGVPTNITVIWIHTRKDSRVAKNKFPLIFAAFDLIAMLVALPLEISYAVQPPTQAMIGIGELHIGLLSFLLNGYWAALLSATVDKFYAVFFPFKYRLKRQIFVKIGVVSAFGVNLFLVATVKFLQFLDNHSGTSFFTSWLIFVYSLLNLVIFSTTIVLFIGIVAKLIHNGRKLRTVGTAQSGCVLSIHHV